MFSWYPCPVIKGHWRGLVNNIKNCTVRPIIFLMNVFFAVKGSKHFILMCYNLLLQLVLCRAAAMGSSRTSSIVQIIFYLRSFEISECILGIQKYIKVQMYIIYHFLAFSITFCNFLICSIFFLAFIGSYKGSLTRVSYPKLYSLVHLRSYECVICS